MKSTQSDEANLNVMSPLKLLRHSSQPRVVGLEVDPPVKAHGTTVEPRSSTIHDTARSPGHAKLQHVPLERTTLSGMSPVYSVRYVPGQYPIGSPPRKWWVSNRNDRKPRRGGTTATRA